MTVFFSRAEQLAAHLRARILKNEWREPFPNTREWARQLAVGRNNLCAALNILQKQGILEVERRQGVRLKKKAGKKRHDQPRRFVRLLYYGVDYPSMDPNFIHWARPLSTALQERGGQLSVEKHSDERLRELCGSRRGPNDTPEELLLPVGIPAKYQRMLVESGRPCIHVGTPTEGIPIPYILCDLSGAIRHATHALLRRGFKKLTFLLCKTHSSAELKMQQCFVEACRDWKEDMVEATTLLLRLNDYEERTAMNQFADGISIPHGILIMPPLSAGLIATTLMARHIRLPSQADIIVVASYPDTVRIYPPLTLYPFPLKNFIKTLSDAVFAFWETGLKPEIRESLPMVAEGPRHELGGSPSASPGDG